MDTAEVKIEAQKGERSFFGIIIHSFFVIPFLIAVFGVLFFTAIHLLTKEERSVYDYLNDVKVGGRNRRWQSAFQLSKILAHPEFIPKDTRFKTELIHAFHESRHDEALIRQYLALAMGRSGLEEFFKPLAESLIQEKEENLPAIIYALGMLKDKRAVDSLISFLNHPQARIRSAAVVALGSIADSRVIEKLKVALNDPEPNVQWGAALSLARMHSEEGKRIILKLLDRNYFANFPEIDHYERNQIILMAIESIQNVNDPEFNARLKNLALNDENMKVRQLAWQAIDASDEN